MTKKGETLSEEIKKKIGNSLRGKPMTEEWKRKHSEYMKKFHQSEEGKAFFKKVAEKVSKTNIRLMKEHGASYAYNKRFKKGIYHSDVFNKDFPYDSGWELIFIKYIEDNSIKEGITVFDRCMDTVEYKMSNGSIHRYLPDFFIRFDSGIRIVIEIKPDYLVNSDEKVIAKSIAGKEYFNKKNIKYVILTEKMFLKNGRIISPDFRLSELIKDL